MRDSLTVSLARGAQRCRRPPPDRLMSARRRPEWAAGTGSVAATVALLAVAGHLPGQLQFEALAKRHLPLARHLTSSAARGDVDSDGDLDLVFGNGRNQFWDQNRLYLNDGTGIFSDVTASRLPADQDQSLAVVLGDVDRDGDLDIVFGNDSHQNRLYLNDGRGTFTDATTTHMPVDNDQTQAAAFGDVDRDGDLDLCFGNRFGQDRLYLNDGAGHFTDVTATHLPQLTGETFALAVGDVDGDGDLDLVTGNGLSSSEQNRLYLNDGNGFFTDATATHMPAASDQTQCAVMADVDGDGNPDLVFGNRGHALLYRNSGTGVFTDVTATNMPRQFEYALAVAAADLDGDGDLDLVLGTDFYRDLLYLNDGSGTFSDGTAARMPPDLGYSVDVLVGDMDSDGDPDLVLANSRDQNRLFLNDGSAAFTDATASRLQFINAVTQALAAADLDADGDTDLILGNLGNPQIYRNDGFGAFVDADATSLRSSSPGVRGVALGDVDRDGDLDLVFANGFLSQEQNRLYLNDGRGTFVDTTAARLPALLDESTASAMADVDNDGDIDLVFANETSRGTGAQNRLYLNDGTGAFNDATAARLPPMLDNSMAVVLRDLDGDGDIDLVFANRRQQNRLYLNNGSGTFIDATAARLPTDADDSRCVAVGDVDSDGDLDLFFGNARTGGEQNRLYLNDGNGNFTDVSATRLPATLDQTLAAVFGDVDGDGDPDLVLGNGTFNGGAAQNALWLNDGHGSFADATVRLPAVLDSTQAVLVQDLDGDGDPDLLFGNSGVLDTENYLYSNLLRQLDSPLLTRLGHDDRLDVYARYHPSPFADVALPYLSTATAHIPLPPLGIVGIDPSQMAPLPMVIVPQPAGVGSVTFRVPANPTLQGVRIYAQALLIQPPLARLTNVTPDLVLR